MADQANADEGADPSGDVKRQDPGGTTTADLVERGRDQDPSAPAGDDHTAAANDIKVTRPGGDAGDAVGLSHAPA